MPDWRRHIARAIGDAPFDPSKLAEIGDELAADLDDRYHALLADGVSAADAERAVLAQLDDGTLRVELERVLDRMQSSKVELGAPAARAGVWTATWRDARYGLRQLQRNPGFTAAALVCLALGIGANTALFELFDAIRLRTLPVSEPQELAAIHVASPNGRTGHFRGASELTTRLFETIRADQQGFDDIAGWSADAVDLSRAGEIRDGRVLLAGGNLFPVLGVGAAAGRLITAADDQPGCGSPPAVVSDGYWRTAMGANASAIGGQVWVNRRAFDVVGVAAPGFFGLEVGRRVDVVLPLCAQPLIEPDDVVSNNPIGWWLGAVGRLKAGWTIEKASAQLVAVSPAVMRATMPAPYNATQREQYVRMTLSAVPIATGYSPLRKTYDRPLTLLLGIAGLVLLIACANLANLMLARTSAREGEMAVRLALGASRGRLLRQLLAENLVLATAGAAAGAAVASALSRALIPLLGGRNQHIFVDVRMDWRVLAFTGALALFTCLLFGLSPALEASGIAPVEAAKAGSRRVVASRSGARLRRALIAAQIALSLTLVTTALLFVQTFHNLLDVKAGFSADGVAVVGVDFSALNIPPARRFLYKQQVTSLIRSLPGVESAARSSFEPVNGGQWNEMIDVPPAGTHKELAWFDAVSPGYFGALRNRILAGRDFTENDRSGAPRVAIISRTFAIKLFHDPAPLGRVFGVVQYGDQPAVMYEVIGVAEDLKYSDLRSDFEPIAYVSDAQDPSGVESAVTLLVRGRTSATARVADIREALQQFNPQLAIRISQLKDDVADGVVAERLMAMLAGFFGVLAIVLAAIGLYGVIAYSVAQRTNEIGIRMALGAGAGRILRLVISDAAGTLIIGIASGTLLTLTAAPVARSLLFGLRPTDPLTLTAAIGVIALVALPSSLLPAVRAARLDPVSALGER